jgi:hypothetical protein
MRILYVAEATMPGKKADSIHVMRMCRSIVKAGHEVKLLAFRGDTFESMEECFNYYGVDPVFQARFIKPPGTGRIASLVLGITAMQSMPTGFLWPMMVRMWFRSTKEESWKEIMI